MSRKCADNASPKTTIIINQNSPNSVGELKWNSLVSPYILTCILIIFTHTVEQVVSQSVRSQPILTGFFKFESPISSFKNIRQSPRHFGIFEKPGRCTFEGSFPQLPQVLCPRLSVVRDRVRQLLSTVDEV